MSNKIIKKALEELNKESPRLDYVRGMLEVIAEEDEKPFSILTSSGIHNDAVEAAKQLPMDSEVNGQKVKSNLLIQDKKIQDLLSEMSAILIPEKTIEETVKKYTKLDFLPDNFTQIISILESMKDKVKIVDSTEQGGTTITKQKVK